MPESLLSLLTFCVLALLYLFFFRVLRAVWAQLKPPVAPEAVAAAVGPAAAPTGRAARKAAKGRQPQLTVVAPKDRKGRSWVVASELTMGRAPGCAVLLEDGFVSQLHARVWPGPDGVYVEDLGSRNGTVVNGKPATEATRLRKGDRITVGSTTFEVR